MIAFVRSIRKAFPFLWTAFEAVNGLIVKMLLSRRLRLVVQSVEAHEPGGVVRFRKAEPKDLVACSRFLTSLDDEDLRYFKPFDFGRKNLGRVLSGGSYLVFLAEEAGSECVPGFFFLRVFMHGKAFLGFSVAKRARGRGLGREMVKALAEGAKSGGLDLYSTVSERNEPSMRAHLSGGLFEVGGTLPDGYLVLRLRKAAP